MEKFNLEAYICKYAGHTKTARLVFIANCAKETPQLQKDAYQLALSTLKAGTNMSMYQSVAAESSALFETAQFDEAAFEATEKKCNQVQERLEVELNSYKTNLMKENIRVRIYSVSSSMLLSLNSLSCTLSDGKQRTGRIFLSQRRTEFFFEKLRPNKRLLLHDQACD